MAETINVTHPWLSPNAEELDSITFQTCAQPYVPRDRGCSAEWARDQSALIQLRLLLPCHGEPQPAAWQHAAASPCLTCRA